MIDKEKKNKIADILLDFYDEYHSNEINRPMIPSIYADKILNSLQEEPESHKPKITLGEATGKLKELVDNISEEGLVEAHKQLEELTKECMYSKDNYTDEDRKVLCDGCEEECRFNKKEEPVSEEMWEALKQYALRQVLASTDAEMSEQDYLGLRLFSGFELAVAHKDGAQWQKQKDKEWLAENHKQIFDNGYEEGFEIGRDDMEEQMMAKAVDATVHIDAGGYPYIPQMELYNYEKDTPFAKEGDKYKVILIKED